MTTQHDVDLVLAKAYARFMDVASRYPAETSNYVALSDAFLRYHVAVRAGLSDIGTLDDELRRLLGGT